MGVEESAQSLGGALSLCTTPSPPSSAYTSTSPAEPAGWEAKWCEAGSFLTSSITPPRKLPQSACQRRVDGLGPLGRLKQVQPASFIYGQRFTSCATFYGCVFIQARQVEVRVFPPGMAGKEVGRRMRSVTANLNIVCIDPLGRRTL